MYGVGVYGDDVCVGGVLGGDVYVCVCVCVQGG